MEPLKVTFDRELTFEGKTFEKEAVYGFPKEDEHYVGESGAVEKAPFNYISLKYPILTQNKKVYTVITVEGYLKTESVFGYLDNGNYACINGCDVVSSHTVEE